MHGKKRFIIILSVIFIVLLSAFVLWRVLGERETGETAVAVQMMKTEGTVTVTNSSAREIKLLENMRLYNGYFVSTDEESYAWVNLDDTKLAKLDAVSRMELRKDGKKLQILVHEGAFFFNVTEPLEDDENMDISTGTMVAGIRGTSGWIRKTDSKSIELCILEGETQCTVINPVTGEQKTGMVSSGEIARFWWDEEKGTCGIDIRRSEPKDIPGFVLKELEGDTELQEKILDLSGIDLRNLTGGEVRIRLEKDQADTAGKLEQIAAGGSDIPVISKDPVWKAASEDADGETGESATEPEAERHTEPDTEKVAESAAEPITKKPAEPATEPEAERPAGPATEPEAERPAEPATEPETERPAEPATEPETERPAEPATEPETERPTEPATESKTYTVTYMLDGVQMGEVETYKYGTVVSVRDKAVKEGYTVTDWSRTGSFTMPAENIVITATGIINTYTVAFDANGGALTGSGAVTADYNTTVALPEPVKAGYDFLGWFTEAENGTKFTADTAVTKSYTLYAQWTAAEAKIMFDANGGNGAPMGITGVTDESISDAFPTDEPAREGYVFAGWYSDKDGLGEAINGYPASFSAGTATYYARWDYIAGSFIVAGGKQGIDYSYSETDKMLTILTGTAVDISGSTTEDTIAVADGIEANVTLSGVSIDLSSAYDKPSPFFVPSGAGATITLEGDNILKAGGQYAALEKSGTDGFLTIRGDGSLTAEGYTGIGSATVDTGNITIESGTIKATGSASGAGIGGGYCSDGSNIKILGGNVTAVGGECAAGIGGGSNTPSVPTSDTKGRGINITISGGVVTAIGGSGGGAGIGGGLYNGWGVDISITGGVVTAIGGSDSGGLGTVGGAGIGGGAYGGNGTGISVTGGIVKATAGNNASFIGGGSDGNGESVDLANAKVILFKDTSGQVYGEVTLDSNLEIKAGETLHIPSGSKLIISDGVTLTNNGTITYEASTQEDAVSGNLVNNGTINGSGQAQGISETATRQIMLQIREMWSNLLKAKVDLTDKEEAS